MRKTVVPFVAVHEVAAVKATRFLVEKMGTLLMIAIQSDLNCGDA